MPPTPLPLQLLQSHRLLSPARTKGREMMVSPPCLLESNVAQSSLEGPAHGRPMQLRSASGGSSGVERTGSNSRQANVALQRS
jgi:hypothetical protein